MSIHLLVNMQHFKTKMITCSGLWICGVTAHVPARTGKCSHMVNISLWVLLAVFQVSCEAWVQTESVYTVQIIQSHSHTHTHMPTHTALNLEILK